MFPEIASFAENAPFAEIAAWVLGGAAALATFMCILYRSEVEMGRQALEANGKLYSKLVANRDGTIFSQARTVEQLKSEIDELRSIIRSHDEREAAHRAKLSAWGKAARAKQLGRLPAPDAPLIDGPRAAGEQA